jgi:hypothetical protein
MKGLSVYRPPANKIDNYNVAIVDESTKLALYYLNDEAEEVIFKVQLQKKVPDDYVYVCPLKDIVKAIQEVQL